MGPSLAPIVRHFESLGASLAPTPGRKSGANIQTGVGEPGEGPRLAYPAFLYFPGLFRACGPSVQECGTAAGQSCSPLVNGDLVYNHGLFACLQLNS